MNFFTYNSSAAFTNEFTICCNQYDIYNWQAKLCPKHVVELKIVDLCSSIGSDQYKINNMDVRTRPLRSVFQTPDVDLSDSCKQLKAVNCSNKVIMLDMHESWMCPCVIVLVSGMLTQNTFLPIGNGVMELLTLSRFLPFYSMGKHFLKSIKKAPEML